MTPKYVTPLLLAIAIVTAAGLVFQRTHEEVTPTGTGGGGATTTSTESLRTWEEVTPAEFVLIQPGTFTMGSPPDELGRSEDEAQHKVALTRGFYLQSTEVTQGQWQALMGNNPSEFKAGADFPVETVNWWEAAAYANAHSRSQRLAACYTLTSCMGMAGTGMTCGDLTVNARGGNPYMCTGYRLPTEAEWEYACRAGTTTAFHNGGDRAGELLSTEIEAGTDRVVSRHH